jgi:hypothetical protein
MNQLRISSAVLLLGITVAAPVRADIGPPRPPITQDFRFFAATDFSDYTIFVCRTNKAAETLAVTPDKPIVVKGVKGGQLWLAAVSNDMVKSMGGKDKVIKALAGKPVDGVLYTDKWTCDISVKFATSYTSDIDITGISDKGIKTDTLSPEDAKKRLQKKGSGSGSKSQLTVFKLPSDEEDSGTGDMGDKLRWILAGLALAAAMVFSGVWLSRRWFAPRVAPVS